MTMSDKRKAYMKEYRKTEKYKKYRRDYQRANYKNINPDKVKSNADRMKELNAMCRRFVKYIKLVYGCMNPSCKWKGDFESSMLDFHHIDNKKFHIAQGGSCFKRLVKEINKCIVICSNCHRAETWNNYDLSTIQNCNVDASYIRLL